MKTLYLICRFIFDNKEEIKYKKKESKSTVKWKLT